MPRAYISLLPLILMPVVLTVQCSGRFVRKEDLQRISKNYEQVYVLKEKIDIGNFDSLNKGAKVRIFFKTAGDYVSVYAYPYSQPREEAVGKNIMQLFETDFPDKKFKEEIFKEKIFTLLDEYKGKLDALPTKNSFGSDLKKSAMPLPDGSKPSRGGGGRPGRRGR